MDPVCRGAHGQSTGAVLVNICGYGEIGKGAGVEGTRARISENVRSTLADNGNVGFGGCFDLLNHDVHLLGVVAAEMKT